MLHVLTYMRKLLKIGDFLDTEIGIKTIESKAWDTEVQKEQMETGRLMNTGVTLEGIALNVL